MAIDEKAFREILSSLSSSIAEQNEKELGEDVIEKIKHLSIENREWVLLKLSIMNGTIEDAIAETIDCGDTTKHNYRRRFLGSRAISDFWDKFFSSLEGSACSHDKTHYLLRMMEKSLKNDTNYNLLCNYTGKEEWNKEHTTGICYWCPMTIKDTETAWKLYTAYYRVDIPKFLEILGSLKDATNEN